MTDALTLAIPSGLPDTLAAGGLVFLRVGAVMALLPGLGDRMLPVRVRLLLALAFSAVTLAAGPALPAFPAAAGDLIRLMAIETVNGLTIGLILRLGLIALDLAATIIAQSGSLSQMFGTMGEPATAIGRLLVLGGLCLAMVSGLHVRAAALLILSYEALPAGTLPPAALVRGWVGGHLSAAFATGFTLALPIVAAALIFNLALGAVSRAMPMLMVTFLAAPVQAAGLLALTLLLGPALLGLWYGDLAALLANPFGPPR